jgi:ERCC4-related helicase
VKTGFFDQHMILLFCQCVSPIILEFPGSLRGRNLSKANPVRWAQCPVLYAGFHAHLRRRFCTLSAIVFGGTRKKERDRLYEEFRSGAIAGLVLSRVGNFALDLPDADVLIQVSGKYGSRQEEAQRLGRVLQKLI